MKENFANYEQSLALRDLGFDEPCLLNIAFNNLFMFNGEDSVSDRGEIINYDFPISEDIWFKLNIPLISSVFTFFREKYGYFCSPTESDDDITKKYDWLITKNLGEGKMFVEFIGYKDTYQEAQTACIDKLIEIEKNGK